MITCKEFEDFINDYLDGNLPFFRRILVTLHLLKCRDCRAYIGAYKKSIKLGQAFFENLDSDVPKDMPEDLISIIMKNRKQQ